MIIQVNYKKKPFLSNYYLAVPVKGSDIGAYAMEVVFLLIPFFLIKSVIKNIRKNKAEYENYSLNIRRQNEI